MTDVTRTTATISWGPPISDGGAAISAYVIEKREATRTIWNRIARVKPQSTSYTVTNLLEGCDYFFRIYAENIEGVSPPLTLDIPVTLRRAARKFNGSSCIMPKLKAAFPLSPVVVYKSHLHNDL